MPSFCTAPSTEPPLDPALAEPIVPPVAQTIEKSPPDRIADAKARPVALQQFCRWHVYV
jgi:hypothetical protein